MKKIVAVIFLLAFLIFNTLAFAHPATDIIFNFNAQNKMLSLAVAHAVENPGSHFIKKIIVKRNGKEWIIQNFLSQYNAVAQAVGYVAVDLKKGDTIEILAVCNKGGELKKEFKIE